MQRIAVGMFFTECNHLGGIALTLADFERLGLTRGPAMLTSPLPPVLVGIIETLRARGKEVVPLLKAEATCGAPLTASCWDTIRDGMLAQLRSLGNVDGVLLALHGSAAAENALDPEGELLEAVRVIVGPRVPIVATLDHHANITGKMAENVDALLAWETYPHRDSKQTGERGARLLADMLDGKCRPTMAVAKVPVLVSGCHGHTDGEGPFADLMRRAKKLEGHNGVLSANMFLVHPYLDVPDMGGGAIVITDGDMQKARQLAGELAMAYWDRRQDLEPPVLTPEAPIQRGLALPPGPVLLVETADCIGGGAAGDSVATLKVLLRMTPNEPSVAPVIDPDAAAACHAAGVGAKVKLRVGHKLVPKWGTPLEITGRVETLSNGAFKYDGGVWGGNMVSMGSTAVVRVGEVRVLIMSIPTYDWSDEQFRAVGIDWRAMRFVVVKNPMNYRLTLLAEARAAFILDTPGPTPATLRHVKYAHVRRPYFPADAEIVGLKPTVLTGHQ